MKQAILVMGLLVSSLWGQCGPPSYSCARTDLSTVTLPSVPPQMGANVCNPGSLYTCGNLTGVGDTSIDPNFGFTVSRLTDSTTGFPGKLFQTHTTTGSGSGEEQLASPDSPPSRIITDDSGGRTFPMIFTDNGGNVNGAGMTASRMYASNPTWSSSGGFFVNTASFWGHVAATPDILYVLGNGQAGTAGATGLILGHFDLTSTTTPPASSAVQDFDFTNCANSAAGGTFGSVTWTTIGGTDQANTDFAFGISNSGGQAGAGAIFVVVWRKGSGCRYWNISTNAIGGDWGSAGTASTPMCTGGKIHNIKIFKSGGSTGALNVTVDNGTGCPTGGYVWFYTGLTTGPECTGNCSGHQAKGMTTYLNEPGNAVPNFMTVRQNTNVSSFTGIIPALPVGGIQNSWDWHPGWNQLNDAWPPCGSTTAVGYPVLRAWTGEVDCVDPAGVVGMYRFANNYCSGGNIEFSTSNCIGAISQDGGYYFFTSDWMNTLGCFTPNGVSSTTACVPGGPKWDASTGYAAGAFIVPNHAGFSQNNPGQYTFQASTACTSGATVPAAWPQTVGQTVTDGTCTWTNLGTNNTRGDVFVVRMTSSAPIGSHIGQQTGAGSFIISFGVSGHTATGTWAASTGAVSYNVYRSFYVGGSCGTLGKINTSPITALTYTDATLQSGQAYCYAVTAVNTNGESGFSNVVTNVVIPFP